MHRRRHEIQAGQDRAEARAKLEPCECYALISAAAAKRRATRLPIQNRPEQTEKMLWKTNTAQEILLILL